MCTLTVNVLEYQYNFCNSINSLPTVLLHQFDQVLVRYEIDVDCMAIKHYSVAVEDWRALWNVLLSTKNCGNPNNMCNIKVKANTSYCGLESKYCLSQLMCRVDCNEINPVLCETCCTLACSLCAPYHTAHTKHMQHASLTELYANYLNLLTSSPACCQACKVLGHGHSN